MLQINLDNFYPSQYAKGFSNIVELQGPEISLDYLYKNKFLFGIGLGPVFMNGNVIGNKNYGGMMELDFGKWVNFFYVIDLHKIRTLVCLGGKVGEIPASYRILNDSNWDEVIPDYSVKEIYYGAIGSKILFGFKYFRIYGGGFLNFGTHTETVRDHYFYNTKINEKSNFALSSQFELGFVAFVGR